MEWQAEVCARRGSPFYAGLLPMIAADLRRGGPALDVLASYLSAPSTAAVPLRLLGAVHALVLTGQAPDLAACYPSAGAAPGARGADAWPAFGRVLAEQGSYIQGWLLRPPADQRGGPRRRPPRRPAAHRG
jgi:hypothetical protein